MRSYHCVLGKKFFALQCRYYILHKPYGYLSQFTDEGRWKGLQHILDVPKDIYPVGRLDADSEGLLILTNDKTVNNRLLNPKFKHKRTYVVQVEGDVSDQVLLRLENPLEIKINKKTHRTARASAKKISEPEWLEKREPPIRERKSVPTSWLELTITEGKNRQVRKMTAAVGFPTLRLLRFSIEDLTILDLKQGQFLEVDGAELKSKLYL